MRRPSRASVRDAVAAWASDLAADRPDVRAVGYFGSLARGDEWGVGSDADLLVLVDAAEVPFVRRGGAFEASGLPVPADVLVYTVDEWDAGPGDSPFHRRARREAAWVSRRPSEGPLC